MLLGVNSPECDLIRMHLDAFPDDGGLSLEPLAAAAPPPPGLGGASWWGVVRVGSRLIVRVKSHRRRRRRWWLLFFVFWRRGGRWATSRRCILPPVASAGFRPPAVSVHVTWTSLAAGGAIYGRPMIRCGSVRWPIRGSPVNVFHVWRFITLVIEGVSGRSVRRHSTTALVKKVLLMAGQVGRPVGRSPILLPVVRAPWRWQIPRPRPGSSSSTPATPDPTTTNRSRWWILPKLIPVHYILRDGSTRGPTTTTTTTGTTLRCWGRYSVGNPGSCWFSPRDFAGLRQLSGSGTRGLPPLRGIVRAGPYRSTTAAVVLLQIWPLRRWRSLTGTGSDLR